MEMKSNPVSLFLFCFLLLLFRFSVSQFQSAFININFFVLSFFLFTCLPLYVTICYLFTWTTVVTYIKICLILVATACHCVFWGRLKTFFSNFRRCFRKKSFYWGIQSIMKSGVSYQNSSRLKPTSCLSVPQHWLTSCLWLLAPSPLVPPKDIAL